MDVIPLLVLVSFSVAHGESPANWTGPYPPCNRHSELVRKEHMDLGVRLATANRVLVEQFRRALNSWASVVDLEWHEDDTPSCSIELVDGERQLFQSAAMAARSQLPDRLDFQGWIAFNPRQQLNEIELYRISVHEIGHMLGLQHSSNAMSVMYGFDLDCQEWLDRTDLAELGLRPRKEFRKTIFM